MLLFVFFTLGQWTYGTFHNIRYQICEEDQALIVGFDSEGQAIEKPIVSREKNGTCVLGEGYRLEDVTGKELHVQSFAYLVVEKSGSDQ